MSTDAEVADRLERIASAMRWNARLGSFEYGADEQHVMADAAVRLRARIPADMDTAPKEIVGATDGHRYGPWFLGWADYEWRRLRWWETDKGGGGSNFVGDCGNAFHPKAWMPLPSGLQKAEG